MEKNKELLIDYINNNGDFKTSTNILNTNQTVFTLVEKIIYELAMFHFKRLNIEYDPNRYFIEYWWKSYTFSTDKVFKSNQLHSFHSDKDEYAYRATKKLIHPFLATVTYLNDSLFPTLIEQKGESTININ